MSIAADRDAVQGAAAAPAPRADDDALLAQVAQRARAPLIIERPEGVLSAGKLTRHIVTLLWWTVWGHFMLPLVTLMLWMSGFKRFSEQLLGEGGLRALINRLPLYAAVVGLMCGTLICWALLNWWRFGQKDRRQSSRAVSAEAYAHSYGIAPDELRRWRGSQRLVVVHDAEGRPTGTLPAADPGR